MAIREIKLPKFKIFGHNDLVETLKYLEISDIFEKNCSEIRMMNHPFFIRNLIQVANFGVEESNERIASDPNDGDEKSYNPYEFIVTRPFLFFVYSYSDNIIYISAAITNPNASKTQKKLCLC
ncbi:Heparin cofactor 2 [Thelohanellus kitauei]|uniref:Heparin cofactor 2 n=1 Tax=Thelohanellus kitauei TaxID=669202 RepID=A0A0C2IJP9_THEKT|nr:Heparin cofactor 2 [Thelohanellus kitauei]